MSPKKKKLGNAKGVILGPDKISKTSVLYAELIDRLETILHHPETPNSFKAALSQKLEASKRN